MQLSMTTDYVASTGDPSPYLKDIANAGFTHVHWCHQWNTDFLYSKPEIDQIGTWLREFGLKVLDLHGSMGPEKNWASPREYERQAGVELVRNRIEMTARLGGDVVIMHVPAETGCQPLRRSLDELRETARQLGVRIALENGSFPAIRELLAAYEPGYLGLCYDSGHGNLVADGLDRLAAIKGRLISVHLHDNNGLEDEHKPVFTGTVDWPRLARILAESSYRKCVSTEANMRKLPGMAEHDFLRQSYDAMTRFGRMVEMMKEGSRLGA